MVGLRDGWYCHVRNVHDKMADGEPVYEKRWCEIRRTLVPVRSQNQLQAHLFERRGTAASIGQEDALWDTHKICNMSRERVVRRFAHCELRRPREPASLRYPCQTATYSATAKSSTTRLSTRPVAVAATKFRPVSEPHPATNTYCEKMTASVPPSSSSPPHPTKHGNHIATHCGFKTLSQTT